MKVKEFAESQGVSSQAVYQRLKGLKGKTGKPLSYYIEPKSNELTGEGLEILQKLYREKQQIKQIPVKSLETTVKELRATIENLETNNQALRKEIDSREKEIERFQDQISRLENQIDELRNDKKFLKDLTETLANKQKQGFFHRLLYGKKDS